jgi:FG-GAP-like repeat
MKRLFSVLLILPLAVTGCSAQTRQKVDVLTSKTVSVGSAPNSVEIADVNGDRHLDLIIANGESNDITVLLGDGHGNLTPAKGSPFPAGHAPNDIAIADFNGDGKLDMAVANHEEKYLTILVGDGQGGFKPAPGSPIRVLTRPHTHGVATGDFNGDGKLDLVTESWGENKVTVVFGDGRGGFSTPGVQFSVGKRPYQRVRVADVNGDGNRDIITTNSEGDNITVLLGDGKGTFKEATGSPFACGRTPFFVAIGDLNGDHLPDLAIANWAGQPEKGPGEGVTVMLGDGRGGFKATKGSPLPAGHGPTRLAIGDVNGDGNPDIVVTNYIGNDATILLGSKGMFTRGATIPVGKYPDGIAIADLNGDGKGDIVIANTGDDDIVILFGK